MIPGKTLAPGASEGFRIQTLDARLDALHSIVDNAGFCLSALGCRYRRLRYISMAVGWGGFVLLLHRLSASLTSTTTTISQHCYHARHVQSAMDNPPKIPSGYADRTLRIIMIFAFFPALALLTACAFAFFLVPTIGLIPMTVSLAVNIIALKNPKSPIRTKPLADAIVALALLAVMAYRFV
jgi:hypothetical protein